MPRLQEREKERKDLTSAKNMKTVSKIKWGTELPRLNGKRVNLRGLTESDAAAIFAIFGDPEVIRYWSSPPLTDIAAATELVKDTQRGFEDRSLFEWGTAVTDSDEIIGTCTLLNLDPAHKRAEVGYAVRRDYWGKGYAKEALELLLTYAFGPLGLHRLEADVHPANIASIRLLERQGFRREGYLRERWHHLGKIEDGVFFGLLKHEWTPSGPNNET